MNVWNLVNAQNEAAQVNAAMSALEGLLKSNPHKVTDPATLEVMLAKANDVKSSLDALKAVVDANLGGLAKDAQQAVLDAYGELLIQLADLKKMADNRFLTQVSQVLADSYTSQIGTIFVWGSTFQLVVPQTPSL